MWFNAVFLCRIVVWFMLISISRCSNSKLHQADCIWCSRTGLQIHYYYCWCHCCCHTWNSCWYVIFRHLGSFHLMFAPPVVFLCNTYPCSLFGYLPRLKWVIDENGIFHIWICIHTNFTSTGDLYLRTKIVSAWSLIKNPIVNFVKIVLLSFVSLLPVFRHCLAY